VGTPRQQEIKGLLETGREVSEIAEILNTTAQAVYSQISRMRSTGILPKAGRRGRPRSVAPAPVPEAPANGSVAVSLESHLEQELRETTERLAAIDEQRIQLADESTVLAERKSRLESASAALTAVPEPAAA